MIDPRLPAVAVCLCAIAGSACGRQAPEEVETASAVAVTTTTAQRGTIRSVVHATGVVSPAPDAELVVVAPETARIADIPHAVGERVRRGDLLVRFEIPAAIADVEKQQAEVTRTEAGVENANAAETRARNLFERGVAARKEVEDATRAVADARAALAQATAALNAARTVDRRATVRATFDGIIAMRAHNAGDLVEAAASDAVLRVIDPLRLEVVASVPLSAASQVKAGARARLTGAATGPADSELIVTSRPIAVDPGTATVPVRLAFEHAVGMPVGMPVQVDIAAETHQSVVLVPAAAVMREGDDTAVFVVDGGKAHRHPVRLGLTDNANIEIVSGVAAGDRVIVGGQAGLPDEAPVTEAAARGANGAAAAQDGSR